MLGTMNRFALRPELTFLLVLSLSSACLNSPETYRPDVGFIENAAPVAVEDQYAVMINTTTVLDLTANDTDADDDQLVISSFTNPTTGSLVLGDANTLVFSSAATAGTVQFEYTISDGQAGEASASVTIEVIAQNELPVAFADTATTQQNRPIPVMVLANDLDPDGDQISVIGVDQPANATVEFDASSVTYVPNPSFYGTEEFAYTISDGRGLQATAYVQVTVNGRPVLGDDIFPVAIAGTTSLDVLANDSDPDGDSFSISMFTQPSQGTVEMQGQVLAYTPPDGFRGNQLFTYTVEDLRGGVATASVTGRVSSPPVTGADNVLTQEDEAIEIAVLSNDSDPEMDVLAISNLTQPTNGIARATTTGTITYTPNLGFTGSDQFYYSVTDGNLNVATGTVTITVNGRPVLGADLVYASVDTTIDIAVLDNDSDPEADALSVVAVETPPSGTATIAGSNLVRFTPATGFRGAVRFAYTVMDARGGQANAQIEVVVNSAPLAVNDNATTQQDTVATVSVLANDSDPDNNRLFVSGAQPGTNGVVNINSDNTVTYTPNLGFYGSDSFVYTIDDGRQGTATAIVSIVINSRPIATDDSYTTQQATQIALDVLANDSDPEMDPIQIETVLSVFTGTITNIGNQSLTYTPNTTFFGVETISYTIIDNRGGRDSAQVTVTVNGQTTAINDTALTQVDTPVVIDVLANDTDPEGDPLSVLNFTQPLNGTVVTDAGGLRYTPNTGFNGNDVFSYTITDPSNSTASAEVTVRVNAPPVANPDAQLVQFETTTLIDVLANDSDPDNDPLSIDVANFGAPSNGGTLTSTAGDIVRYTPATGFAGTETFTYRVIDSSGGFATGTVTITINRSPTAVDDTDLAQSETALTIAVLTNDSDADSDPINIVSVTQGQNGTVTIAGTGTEVVYLSDQGFFGIDTFTYTIEDGRGGSATATVNLDVNAPPVVVNDVFNVLQDTVTLLDVLDNDDSPDQDALTLVSVLGVANGAIVLVNNALEYTPNAGYVGPDSFNYTMRDDNGGSATGTVTLSVVNRATLNIRTEALTGIPDAESIAVALFDTDQFSDVVTVNRRANRVTIVAGLQGAWGERTEFAVQNTPVDVAVGDFNGDGSPDIVVANFDSGTVSVLLNTATAPGVFSFAAAANFNCGATPNSVHVADVNRDTIPDVLVANGAANTVSILINTTANAAATASFSAAVTLAANNARDVIAADLNQNNALDLVTLNSVAGEATIFMNLTTGTTLGQAAVFSASSTVAVGTNPSSLIMPDINRDGCPDLVVSNTDSDNISVRLNSTPPLDPTPTFRADVPIALPAGSAPIQLTCADINLDSALDIMVTNNGTNTFSALLNTTVGSAITPSFGALTSFNTNVAPWGIAATFIDADQLPDLVVMNSGTDLLTSYTNQTPNGSAVPVYADSASGRMGRSTPVDVEIADLTGDNVLDVISLDQRDATISVFANDTAGVGGQVSVAERATFQFSATQANDLILGDLNGDNLTDALVVDNTVSSLFWRLNSTAVAGTAVSFGNEATLATNANPASAMIADLDADNINDVVIVERANNQIGIYRNQTTGGATTLTFAAVQNLATGLNPTAIAIQDLNADNRPDIVVSNGNQNSVSVLVNQTTTPGTLVFQTVGPFNASILPTALVIADFDGDNIVDIATANQNDDSVAVLRGTTPAGSAAVTFADAQIFDIVPIGSVVTKLSVGDVNNDNRIDLIAATSSDETVSVLYNLTVSGATNMAFTRAGYAAGATPSAADGADLNADGNLDLVITNSASDDLVILTGP